MNQEMANRLAARRREKGLSQEELASRLGVSRQAVSKWERGEASPDTDNLIALAELYGVTLDELVYSREPAGDDRREDTAAESAAESPAHPDAETVGAGEGDTGDADNGTRRRGMPHVDRHGFHVTDGDEEVHIGWSGIHVHDKGDKVDVSWKDGVHVSSANGEEVHVTRDGVHVDSPREGQHIHVEGEAYAAMRRERRYQLLKQVPVWMLTIVAYLLLGFLGGWWHPGWLVFFLIPLYDSALSAFRHRDAKRFAYPVLAAGVYLLMGFLGGWWHPGWVAFLTIPLYYGMVSLFQKI